LPDEIIQNLLDMPWLFLCSNLMKIIPPSREFHRQDFIQTDHSMKIREYSLGEGMTIYEQVTAGHLLQIIAI
jgi:hypothetical protein